MLENILNTEKYFTNCRWPGQRGDPLEEKEETEGVGEVLGTKEISQDQRRQQDIGGAEGENNGSF